MKVVMLEDLGAHFNIKTQVRNQYSIFVSEIVHIFVFCTNDCFNELYFYSYFCFEVMNLTVKLFLSLQDCIDRIQELQADGTLTGVIDDRGKFIYITAEELESVAKFIRQHGRVSITELAESSNRLINLNPDNAEVHKKLVVGDSECDIIEAAC